MTQQYVSNIAKEGVVFGVRDKVTYKFEGNMGGAVFRPFFRSKKVLHSMLFSLEKVYNLY